MKDPVIQAYICSVCTYLYDDESALTNNAGHLIPFTELPEDWQCPICGVNQDQFYPTASDRTLDVADSD